MDGKERGNLDLRGFFEFEISIAFSPAIVAIRWALGAANFSFVHGQCHL